MDTNFGKKLSELRKSNNMTQEELAKILNVTNAAVSKWESGFSYPDIMLLPKLATIFKTSIDSLFGLNLRHETSIEIKEEVLKLLKNKSFIEAINYLDHSLIKYPNDIELNLLMAKVLVTAGLNQREQDLSLVNKALYYYDKVMYLDNEGIYLDQIIQNKSFALTTLGKYDEALELLESMKNDKYIIEIAKCYYKKGNFEKAMKLLQEYLGKIAFNFSELANILKENFEKLGLNEEAYDVLKLSAIFRESFTINNVVNYFDFLVSKDYLEVALYAYKLEKIDEMYTYLHKAIEYAKKYDENPNCEVGKVKFLTGLTGEYQNFGSKAYNYVVNIIESRLSGLKEDKRYKELMKKEH